MKNKDYYIRRAIVGFKTLVIYFTVTRPQYERAYQVNGKFSKDELLKQLDFLTKCRENTGFKNAHLKQYTNCQRTFNYTFDIPSRLIEKVLGDYKDENGKTVRISIKEIVKELEDTGWLRKLNQGSVPSKQSDGSYKKLFWWGNKYFIANKAYWFKLLEDERYSDYVRYRKTEFVRRVVKLISKWRKANAKSPKQQQKVVHTPSPITETVLKNAFMYGVLTGEQYRNLAIRLFNTDEGLIAKRRKWVAQHPEVRKTGDELKVLEERFKAMLKGDNTG